MARFVAQGPLISGDRCERHGGKRETALKVELRWPVQWHLKIASTPEERYARDNFVSCCGEQVAVTPMCRFSITFSFWWRCQRLPATGDHGYPRARTYSRTTVSITPVVRSHFAGHRWLCKGRFEPMGSLNLCRPNGLIRPHDRRGCFQESHQREY